MIGTRMAHGSTRGKEARLPGVLSLEDFDRCCEEQDVQPGQYDVASRNGSPTSRAAPITGEPMDREGAAFTAYPK